MPKQSQVTASPVPFRYPEEFMLRRTSVRRVVGLALIALLAASLLQPFLVAPALADSGPRPPAETTALYLPGPQGYTSLVQSLVSAGGRVLHEFPPDALIAQGPAGLPGRLLAEGQATYATEAPVPDDTLATLSPAAQLAAGAWAALLTPDSAGFMTDSPEHPAGDAMFASDTGGLTGLALDPSLYQQSEFLIGRVAVNIVLVESTGAVDPSAENWSPARQQQVFAQIVQGLEWWRAQEPRAQLQFVYDNHYSAPLPVSYEPVTRPHSEDRLWISESMQGLGFPHSSYITAVRLYNRDSRERLETDWAFTIFVVDSLNDSDNRFADGYFAYAYIHGPYMVMTYGNNGYGIDGMAGVLAHEVGHIFGAMDEYAGAGVPATVRSGYLGVENGNSQVGGITDVGCIMRGGLTPYALHQLCPYTAGQVGWRDSDGDGILDPVDTSLDLQISIGTYEDRVSIEGAAIELPYPSSTRPPITINRLVRLDYRVNGGVWRPLSAADGNLDSAAELLSETLPPACRGDWQIEVRALDNWGVSAVHAATLSIAEGPSPAAITVSAAFLPAIDEDGGTIEGVAVSPIEAGPVLAIQRRIDSGAWTEMDPGDGEYDGQTESFSLTLSSLPPGEHALQFRAAAALPWAISEVWEQSLTVSAPSEPTPSPSDPPPAQSLPVFYLPLVVS